MNQNFTPINHLFTPQPQLQVQGGSGTEKIEIPSYSPIVETQVHEVVEHIPAPEVAEYVNHRKETPEIPKEVEKAGVQAVVNPRFANLKPIALPLSDVKIEQGTHAPVTSSFRWLSELCLYILKQGHLSIKKIGGKVVRIILQ